MRKLIIIYLFRNEFSNLKMLIRKQIIEKGYSPKDTSQWAEFEIELALEKQRRGKKINFLPIKIDNAIMHF